MNIDNIGQKTSKVSASTKKKEYVFFRKPSFKKKGPAVKQTKASMLRIMKANPLLKYEMERNAAFLSKGLVVPIKYPLQLLNKVTPVKETVKQSPPKEFKNPPNRRRLGSIITGNSTEAVDKKKSDISTCSDQPVIEFDFASLRILSSTPNESSKLRGLKVYNEKHVNETTKPN